MIIFYFKLLISLPVLLFRQWFNIASQKRFFQKKVWIPAMNNLQNQQIAQKTLQKITNYYGLYVPAILGTSFCKLRGKKC